MNILKMEKPYLIQGLIKLERSTRWISRETGIYWDTISRYRKDFETVPKVPADFLSQKGQAVPKVPTDPDPISPSNNEQLLPFLKMIYEKVIESHTAQRIYQDLV